MPSRSDGSVGTRIVLASNVNLGVTFSASWLGKIYASSGGAGKYWWGKFNSSDLTKHTFHARDILYAIPSPTTPELGCVYRDGTQNIHYNAFDGDTTPVAMPKPALETWVQYGVEWNASDRTQMIYVVNGVRYTVPVESTFLPTPPTYTDDAALAFTFLGDIGSAGLRWHNAAICNF